MSVDRSVKTEVMMGKRWFSERTCIKLVKIGEAELGKSEAMILRRSASERVGLSARVN